MTKFINPAPDGWLVRGWIPGDHRGTDFGWYNANIDGSRRVVAAAPGRVVSESVGGGYNDGWGNQYIIDHGYGIYTTYNHLATGTMQVNVGDDVQAGTYLGQMGTTGKTNGETHLHFEVRIGGMSRDNRVDPGPWLDGTKQIPGVASTPLSGDERRVGGDSGVRARRDATTSSESVEDGYLDPGTQWRFRGWKRGESVEGNNVWIQGFNSGLWYWSGGFTDTGTHDLADLNSVAPPKVAANQRVVTGEGVFERTGPGTSYERKREFATGDVLDFKGWTRGETITLNGVTTDVWYQGAYSDTWFSGACFTSQSTDGLPEVKTGGSTPPATTVPDWKTRTPDSRLAKWIGSPNFNYREPRPSSSAPTHVTMHWMDGTLAGTDDTFQNVARGSASTYGIGQTEIHQYVRECDYQQADGSQFSNRWGLSIEHEASATNPATQAVKDLSAALLVDIAKRYGWDAYVLGTKGMTEAEIAAWSKVNPTKGLLFWHSKWVDTKCPGTLPYAVIMAAANHLLAPEAEPNPGTPVEDDDQPVTRGWIKALFEVIVAAVRGFFGTQK